MSKKQRFVVYAAAVLSMGSGLQALAQDPQSVTSGTALNTVPASGPVSRKAQLKAERTEARAKRRAELKSLQGAGYQPQQSSTDYPQDLLNAQKKAAATGARQ
ncbi:hypothetical protein [Paraburkholderia caribensis]|uniref:hypothetical protein n=1 Tax=Paraburkholderia caribensis TaxID=75105 RepID=UPI0007220757|nr:hypothetical protein [Paraburkholderia caribensis]ALP68552.1 hypothetical protein AN416_38150 [Paraburkholderia caribensis]AUT57908.1 hypothetical protein C2L66_39120 [Paraburkholderia caribensis]